MIGLSIIFSSLSGMEKKNHYTLTVQHTLTAQPIGGVLSDHRIHYAVVECRNNNNEIDHKACQQFKYRKPTPTLPLNLFTQENQSCAIIVNDGIIRFLSHRLYEENSFIPHTKYCETIFNS
jgi:hypothetical protein